MKEKNGIDCDQALSVFKYIQENCKNLEIVGLMTIGSVDNSLNQDNLVNNDFQVVWNKIKYLIIFFN